MRCSWIAPWIVSWIVPTTLMMMDRWSLANRSFVRPPWHQKSYKNSRYKSDIRSVIMNRQKTREFKGSQIILSPLLNGKDSNKWNQWNCIVRNPKQEIIGPKYMFSKSFEEKLFDTFYCLAASDLRSRFWFLTILVYFSDSSF